METHKLDNPTWYSLSETHTNFAVDFDGIKFYNPDYCPFGGFLNLDNTAIGIGKYASLTNNFFVVGNEPNYNEKVVLNNELICNQMVLDAEIDVEINEQIVELQTEIHKVDLFNLVNLVQPDYFKNRTADLGNYFGIYKDEKLGFETRREISFWNFISKKK